MLKIELHDFIKKDEVCPVLKINIEENANVNDIPTYMNSGDILLQGAKDEIKNDNNLSNNIDEATIFKKNLTCNFIFSVYLFIMQGYPSHKIYRA